MSKSNQSLSEVTEIEESTVDNQIQVKAKLKDKETGEVTGEVSASAIYDFGSTLDESVALFGAEVVHNNFRQSAVISAQSRMRALIAQGFEGEELQSKLSSWKPGIKTTTRKSPADKLKELLAGRSPAEIAELIAAAGIQ